MFYRPLNPDFASRVHVVARTKGEPAALVTTFDGIKEELGAPLDVFVWWEEVWAHLELGNGDRAIGLVKNQESRIEWEGRHRPITSLRVLYEKGRAHELLGEPAEATAAYGELVAQLGEALSKVPRLADTPDRLARLHDG